MIMRKSTPISGTSKKSKIIAGTLLLFIALVASGCGSSNAAATQQTSQTNPKQAGQGQNQRNPALQAASELRRLQNDPQMALSSDQKEKLKPLLQDLINTDNPAPDYLQKQADAINALLTNTQKSYLASSRPNGNNKNNSNNTNSAGNKTNGNNPASNPSGQNAPNGNNRPSGTPNNNGKGRSFDAKTIYQQALDLISK